MEKNNKFIIDTNVALLAGTPVSKIPSEELICAQKCVRFINDFLNNPESKIVLDRDGRILREYKSVYAKLGSQPSLASAFHRWVCTRITKDIDPMDFVELHEISQNVFKEYPDDERIKKFDPSDRKFIAVANAHQEHPAIIEGSDCKWWGIRQALEELGIKVTFMDESYIKMKYEQKIGL